MKLWFGPEQRRRLTERLQKISETISWTTRITGVLVSVLSMHLLVVRPLVDRIDQLQAELHYVDTTLTKVAAQRSSIRETNDLLSGLRRQHEELAQARATIRQLKQLQSEIIEEANRVPEAKRAAKRISELPDAVFQAETDRYSRLIPTPQENSEQDPSLQSRLMPDFFENSWSEPRPTKTGPLAPKVLAANRKDREHSHCDGPSKSSRPVGLERLQTTSLRLHENP